MNSVTVGSYSCGPGQPLLLIAGPCVLQSVDLGLEIAEPLARLNARSDVNVVFKGSFDKANRTSLKAERGTGVGGRPQDDGSDRQQDRVAHHYGSAPARAGGSCRTGL